MEETHSIMCIGLTCLDIVSECQYFPKEDDKIGSTTTHNRCSSQRWQRGGNASNNCTVLAMLGEHPSLACTLADSSEKQFLLSDMHQCGIDTRCVVVHKGRHCPSSVVLSSIATGSRTIVHSNQDLPEISVDNFAAMPLSTFSWIHFEGRNISNVVEMQRLLRQKRGDDVTISVELEKPRADMESVALLADIVFVSKDYAKFLGYEDMAAAAEGFAKKYPNCTAIVPWGESGACGAKKGSAVVHSPAYPLAGGVVDSLGAGDTFIAATIHALRSGSTLQDCITFGCRLAGLKVCLKGWDSLRQQVPQESWIRDYKRDWLS